MRLRRPLIAFAWTGLLAFLLAFPAGERRLSVQVWFAAISLWIAIELVVALFKAVPVWFGGRVRLSWLFDRWRRSPTSEGTRLRDQRALHGLLLRAVENPRTFDQQLRPRLRALVNHQLPGSSGTAGDGSGPDEVGAAFGDLAWLVDDGPVNRSPTLDDIERFVDRLERASS